MVTLDDLLKSGRLAPVSARRFESALEPAPAGEPLSSATAAFYARREAFRSQFVGLMEREHLDALLYPANQARPATHEGGLARYGEEPGTCEESAMTGLPQVTVPAGFLGGKYPFGISLSAACGRTNICSRSRMRTNQATHHRRPPPRR